jgi:hypothetical protein
MAKKQTTRRESPQLQRRYEFPQCSFMHLLKYPRVIIFIQSFRSFSATKKPRARKLLRTAKKQPVPQPNKPWDTKSHPFPLDTTSETADLHGKTLGCQSREAIFQY